MSTRLRKISKSFVRTLFAVLLLNLLIIIFSNWRVEKLAEGKTFESIESIPVNKVGLILGTSQYLRRGGKNPYFLNRIEAAVELYQADKIQYILVSGDNSHDYYNEPVAMQKELLKRGIPKANIILDFAGFRTLDSIIRSKKVFGQNRITVISQKFHNQRAVYISYYANIQATGYNSKDVGLSRGIRTRVRELLARVKVLLDIHILKKEPKFLGEKVQIG